MELNNEYILNIGKYEYEYSLSLIKNNEEEMKNILNKMYDYIVRYFYTDEEQIKSLLDDNYKRNNFITYESYVLKKHFKIYF